MNTGAVDYTAADPATFTDDLTAVLDDATYNDDASSGATVVGSTLTWSGAVPSGSSLQITYSVTALAAGSGDGVLTNAVIPTAIGGECAPQADCSTSDALRSFTVEKAASTTTVDRGATVVYTIVVTNTGAAAFTADAPARVTDDLTAVLDDASYNGDATNGAVYDAPELSWALALPVGGSVTLTYSVTVDDDPAGDLALVNAVTPGAGGTCAADACTTETPVSGFSVSKAVDVTRTALGSVVTYTISIVNDGAVAFTDENPATFADDLSDVLDDGAYNGDATNGATYDEPVLVWAGALDVGETTTVTYSVTVDDRVNGDRQLENAVLPGAGGDCRPVCTVTTVIEVPSRSWLAVTGLDGAPLAALLGLAALASAAGVVLLLGRRHRDTKG